MQNSFISVRKMSDKAKTAWIVLIVVSIIIIIACGLNLWFTRTIAQRAAVLGAAGGVNVAAVDLVGADATINFQNGLNIVGIIFGVILLLVSLYNYFAKEGTAAVIYETVANKTGFSVLSRNCGKVDACARN